MQAAQAARVAQAARAAAAAAQAADAADAAQRAKEAAEEAQKAKEAADAKAKAAAKADTTTVKGKEKMDCGEDGNYGDLQKKTGDNKFDRDHVPSKAALQAAAEKLLESAEIVLTAAQKAKLFGDNGMISKAGKTIVIPKKDHSKHSASFGNRNSPSKIDRDSDDLQKAAEEDTRKIERDSTEMDADCLEQYKKVAEEIRKKTHAEYMDDIKKLIKEVMKTPK